jgi:hypothetical protein
MTTWHRTTPTRPGWLVASTSRDAECIRWWHGSDRGFSAPAFLGDPPDIVERAKNTPGESQLADGVEWRRMLVAAA